jgi:hypothetical protein
VRGAGLVLVARVFRAARTGYWPTDGRAGTRGRRAAGLRRRAGAAWAVCGFHGVYSTALAGALLVARLTGRTLPVPSAGDIALFGIATHKLSRLLAKDKVTAALRAPFTEYEEKGGPAEVEERPRGRGPRRAIGELVSCPYCLDPWVAGGFIVGSLFAPRATRLTAGVFASVAIADFLQIGYKAGQKAL